MKPSQEKIMSMSKKISIVLKLGFIVSNVIVILSLVAIGILVFSGEDIKSSFLAAFNVTANNGTTISIAAQSLLVMFAFMLIDTILISFAIFFVYAIFNEIRKGFTPFSHENTTRIKKIALLAAILSIVGSYSDALVDYYTIGELTWRINIIGIIVAIIIYCISLIFSYGCDLQKESDETLWGDNLPIIMRLDRVMADRKMSLKELSEKVGVANVNLSKMKTGKISAIRFSTLEAICDVLDCQPGDILEYKKGDWNLKSPP